MEQDIAETLQLLASSSLDNKIRHRVLSAVRFHREKRYFFSERTFKFNLTVGKYDYRPGDGWGLPADLVEVIGDTIWLIPVASLEQRWPLERVGREQMDYDRASEVSNTGDPSLWDWYGGALRLSPTPDEAHGLEGAYVRDLGVPIKKYDTATSTWSFFAPDGSTALGDDFTNHWFDPLGGYELVKQRALSLMYGEVLHNSTKSQEHMTTWLEEKARLEDETEQKTAPAAIVPALI